MEQARNILDIQFKASVLPQEIWISIFEHLGKQDLLGDYEFGENIASVSITSKQFHNIIKNTPKLSQLLDTYITLQNMIVDEIRSSVIKIVVAGSPELGKSATTVQFVNGIFIEHYDPHTGDFYRKISPGTGHTLSINDAVTIESFFQDHHYKEAHGIYGVYSITDRESLSGLRHYLEKCKELKGGRFPLIVCGNKCDLEGQRQVSQDEGNALAREYGGIWMETSAKTAHNISEAFDVLVKRVLQVIQIKNKRLAKTNKGGKRATNSGSNPPDKTPIATPLPLPVKKDKCSLM